MFKIVNILILLLISSVTPNALASLQLNRTRLIFPSTENSVTLEISNLSEDMPFLAQVWLENEQHQQIKQPLAVVPPIQRINPKEKNVLRVIKLKEAKQLPHDRESIFYLSMLQIPPKQDKKDALQLIFQTQIKVFYRPEKVISALKNADQKITVISDNKKITINNPTPFYFTISKIGIDQEAKNGLSGFNSTMIAPFGQHTVMLQEKLPQQFFIFYMNDYGGENALKLGCNSTQQCSVIKK